MRKRLKIGLLKPLDLSNTFLSLVIQRDSGPKHARGYLQLDGASELKMLLIFQVGRMEYDFYCTDLNKFFSCLLGGKIN